MLDAADLLVRAWASVTQKAIARCWVHAKTLPVEMEAKLTAAYGAKKTGDKDPAMDGLAKTLNKASVRVDKAQQEGSPVTDTDIIDLLVNLNITPGEHADESAVQKAQEWGGIEDEEDVVEAMNLDEEYDLAKALAGMGMEDSSPDGGEEDENDGRSTEGGGFEPLPSDAQILQHFGPLEKYASKSGVVSRLGEISYYFGDSPL